MPDDQMPARSAEVAEMLARVDPAAILAVLAGFSPASEIGLRDNWKDHAHWWDSVTRAYKLPKDPRKRLARMREALTCMQVELARDVRRYTILYSQGPAGLSEWDLSQCLGMGRDPVDEWKFALHLKDAHVSYQRTLIHAMMTELDLMEQ